MSSKDWPARSLEECHRIMTAPGAPWEWEERVIKGRTVKVYISQLMPRSLRAFWLASKAFANRDYLVYEGERYTYDSVHRKANQIANLLLSRGVKKGDKVAIASRNNPEWIFAFWGIHLIGAVAVALNAWSPLDALEHCIKLAETKVLFVDEERAKTLRPRLESLKKSRCTEVFVTRVKEAEGYQSLTKAFESLSEKDPPQIDVEPEDYASIFFTSGTTSLPKGVLATQRQFLSNKINTGVGPTRALLRRGESIPVPDPNARQVSLLLSVPLFHVTGNHSFLMIATGAGGKITLMHKWNLPAAIEIIKREKVTIAGGVPSMALEIIEAPELERGDHLLEGFTFGGAPASSKLPERLAKRMPGVNAGQAYGLTETNAIATSHTGEDYLHRPLSAGLPAPTAEVKIIDLETKKEVPAGQSGEICIRGPNVAEGYYKDEVATKRDFSEDGWFRSGDVGYLDRDGFLFVTDRAKEIIIRGGENISTVAVENALYSDERVQECGVVPVPDAKLGELVAAAVTLKKQYQGKVKEEELMDCVKRQMPRHCVPVLLVFRDEGLPRNPAGKFVKKQLKEDLGKVWMERNKVKAKL